MSSSYSPQFVDLCRIQLMLLGDSLGAELGVVYVTKPHPNAQEPQLEPLVSVPPNVSADPLNIGKFLLPSENNRVANQLDVDPHSLDSSARAFGDRPEIEPIRQYPPQRLLQPLTHEGIILGLLLAVRSDRPWQERERQQVEQISQTISLAALIDRERQWATITIQEQQQFQNRQQKIFDNLLHQLRNPLTAIYTFGKLLLKKLPVDDVNRPIATNILRESEHLKELLQLLDNATHERRLGEGEVNLLMGNDALPAGLPLLPPASLQLHPCNIAEILEPIIANAAEIAQEKQLNFHSQIPSELPLVLASANALREILGNLVDNALKYTLQGEVRVTGLVIDQQLAIIISDSGLGIPATDLPQLFQRNYRGSQAQGNIPGTGLGLSIAKDLTEQMGGTITVLSPLTYDANGLGSGSKFTVMLPISNSALTTTTFT
jgi:signal transduction histidine kinase